MIILYIYRSHFGTSDLLGYTSITRIVCLISNNTIMTQIIKALTAVMGVIIMFIKSLFKAKKEVTTNGLFIATDLEFYEPNIVKVSNNEVDKDYDDSVKNRDTLDKMGKSKVRVHQGFDVFSLGLPYKKNVDNLNQPGLIIGIGLYFNTNSVDTSNRQVKEYGTVAEFNGHAIRKMMVAFPGTPIVLITVDKYAVANENEVPFPHLQKLRVKMVNNNGTALTNTRYGVTDDDYRYFTEDHFATCINIGFTQMIPYVDEKDMFDVWSIVSDIINTGQNVLMIASNRFDNAVKLSDYSLRNKGVRGQWKMPPRVFPLTKELRFVSVVLNHPNNEDGDAEVTLPGIWEGPTTYQCLMDYCKVQCPSTDGERQRAWDEGTPVDL